MMSVSFLRSFLAVIGFSGSVLAADIPINWPIEPLPEGADRATFAVPRNDWLEKFAGNLTRIRAAESLDLVFQGDSITEGWRGAGRSIWNERYASLNALYVGIGGDRTENVLWRLRHGELDGIAPRLVVLMIGTNNLARDQPSSIAAGIDLIVQEYLQRSATTHVLLLGIFPRGATASDPLRQKAQAVNVLLAARPPSPRVTYLDIGEKFLDADGTLSRDIAPDLLHLSAEGYRIWSDSIANVLAEHLTVLPKP